MVKLFEKILKVYPESTVQEEKNYVSFSFNSAFYYQLRIMKDNVRMMAVNYPEDVSFGECFKIVREYKIDEIVINGYKINIEAGARNANIINIKIEIPYSEHQLEDDDFISKIIDSCDKFHDAISPLVNKYLKIPPGNLRAIMGADTENEIYNQAKTSNIQSTIQQEISKEIVKLFPDSIIKKIDEDNYLDIHIPSLHPKKGTHIGINTSKGVFRIVFYCRDEDFVNLVLSNSSNLESYAQGIRKKGNPKYNNVSEIVKATKEFVEEILEAKNSEINTVQKSDFSLEKETKNDTKSNEDKFLQGLTTSLKEANNKIPKNEQTETNEHEKLNIDNVDSDYEIKSEDINVGKKEKEKNNDGVYEFFIGEKYEKDFIRFIQISEKTGIVTNEIKVPPNPEERDEIWKIIRSFSERIYEIDKEENVDENELNTLCFFSIIGLHWCDIMINDKRFSYTNGRFRRDTIALALCFYARVGQDYKHYEVIKKLFIMPHMQFSVLLWTINSIMNIGKDHFFGIFTAVDAKKAYQLFSEIDKKNQEKGAYGYISPKQMQENHPLKAIWSEIFNRFNNQQVPYQFIIDYIHNDESSENNSISNSGVNVTLLEIDKEENLKYLKNQLEKNGLTAEDEPDVEFDEETNIEDNNDDSKKGYPALIVKNTKNDEIDKRRVEYLRNWQMESIVYGGRMGIRAHIPEWIDEIDNNQCCPKFSKKELENIENIIIQNKIIPILGYVPERFFQHVKRVWWIVPFCIWREDSVSWIMIDKNGFYCANPDFNDIGEMMSWESITSIEMEYEYDGDPNVNMMTLHLGEDQFLTIAEFVDDKQGSYLSVIHAIYQVREKTIEASRGQSSWKEGSGGEGFKMFEKAKDLLKKEIWIDNPDRPDPRFFA